MPPGSDNICAKSSQFHFVNEFLYKPINLEEHQNKPNVSLKYSDRYYPDNYYAGRYDEEQQQQHYQRKQPVRFCLFLLPILFILICSKGLNLAVLLLDSSRSSTARTCSSTPSRDKKTSSTDSFLPNFPPGNDNRSSFPVS